MRTRELKRRLRTLREPEPPPGLATRLERGIPAFVERPERGWSRRSRTMFKLGGLAAAAAMLAAAAIWIGIGPGGTSAAFAAALEPVIEATDGARAVHLVLRMLTREGEDFGYVHLEGEPRTVEVWLEWPQAPGDPGRARVDKTDRVYVFDGAETIFYHPQRGEAFRQPGRGFDPELFWPANWLRRIRNSPGDRVTVLEHEERAGRGRMTVREPAHDTGPLEPSFLGDFDRETEVEWDLATHLLTALRRYVHVGGERRLFEELVSIEYLPSIASETFALELPADVRWGGVVRAPSEFLEMGPREVAERLFQAALRGERETLELVCPAPSMVDFLLDPSHRPTEILSLGDPFRAGDYPGVFVPYVVRFGRGWGSVKSYNLALRNDNAERRWVYDGGI